MGDMTAALRRIKSQNVNILEDKAKVCAMLSDLEPSMHRERRRIRLFYETGAVHSLAKAVASPEGARLYLSQAVSILTDQADMNASAAAETVNYFTPLWKLPQVESKGGAAAIDTDAMFEMMARADNEKKAAAERRQQASAQKGRRGGRSPVYGQRTHPGPQNNPAFNQPLRQAGRLYGHQQAQAAPQPQPRRIYGSAAGSAAAAGAASSARHSGPHSAAPSGGTQQGGTANGGSTGIFSRRGQQNWKNIAVKVRQTGGANGQGMSPLTAAQQAAEDLCRFYRPQLEALGSDTRRADRLCRKGMLLAALSPSRAVNCFMEAAREGDVAHLSLIGRQIIAWPDYLEIEPSMGFAALQMAVDRGAENGAYALAHCYHTGTGILRCSELAEKYYRQAAARHPEITDQINRRLAQLHGGQLPDDDLWRYY